MLSWSRVWKIWPAWLRFVSFKFFFIINVFSFHHSRKLIRSHVASHMFYKLTELDQTQFFFFVIVAIFLYHIIKLIKVWPDTWISITFMKVVVAYIFGAKKKFGQQKRRIGSTCGVVWVTNLANKKLNEEGVSPNFFFS